LWYEDSGVPTIFSDFIENDVGKENESGEYIFNTFTYANNLIEIKN